MRGPFGPHRIVAEVTDDAQSAPVVLITLLRRCHWGETARKDTSGTNHVYTCVSCGNDQVSFDKAKCELCPVNSNCSVMDPTKPPEVLLPYEKFWHSTAADLTIY